MVRNRLLVTQLLHCPKWFYFWWPMNTKQQKKKCWGQKGNWSWGTGGETDGESELSLLALRSFECGPTTWTKRAHRLRFFGTRIRHQTLRQRSVQVPTHWLPRGTRCHSLVALAQRPVQPLATALRRFALHRLPLLKLLTMNSFTTIDRCVVHYLFKHFVSFLNKI